MAKKWGPVNYQVFIIGRGKKLASATSTYRGAPLSVSLEFDAGEIGYPKAQLLSMLKYAAKALEKEHGSNE